MIKKLRRRFFIVYMAILSCFLITILTGIYFIVYHSEVMHSQQIMEMAVRNNTRLDGMNSSPPKKIINFDNESISVTTAGEDNSIQDTSQSTYTEYPPEDFSNFNSCNENIYYGRYGNFEDIFGNDGQNDFDFDDFYHHDDDDDHQYDHFPPNDFDNDYPHDWDNPPPPPPPMENTSVEDTTVTTTDTSYLDTIITNKRLTSIPEQVIVTITNAPVDSDTQGTLVPSGEKIPVTSNSDTTTTSTTTDTTIDTTQESTSTDTTTDTTITSRTTTTETPPKNHFDDKPQDKPSDYTEYEGNLARNTIYVRVNKDGDIQRISYQYFESGDNISLEQTVGEIIKSGSMEGKVEIDDIKFRYAVFNKGDSSGYDVIFLDRAIEISTLNRLLIIFISIGGLGLLILFGVSWLLASWAITPIAEAWDKQKQFIADASHELKTPLTVIATNTDVVLANAEDTVQNQSKWLTYIKSETARMSKLVSDLLYIAKSDVNEVAMVMNEFNLSHTTLGVCLVFETVAFENGKILDTDIEENISYKGDEDRIKQLITILVDNAIVHSNGNANIMVSLKRDNKDKIKLSVSNTNGEDIPKGCKERLFERFFRVDKARNRSSGSHGLGLNIAQSIVKNHNGSISVTSTKDHVVTFTVTL
ncbi:MAG: HAMP domain-containing sensor histidine kinase [Oscillospiraceae bacterium]